MISKRGMPSLKEENLTATSQLIRFIRGGVTCEEFYTHYPQTKTNDTSVVVSYGFFLLAGFFLIVTGYLILSWQLKAAQSQLAQLEVICRNLETARDDDLEKTYSLQELETRQAFWSKQEALYQDLMGEKLSMSCIFKELSHLSPGNVFFKRISLKDHRQPDNGRRMPNLVLEGTAIKTDAFVDGDFPTFLSRINQSSFFQKVHVDSQKESDTDYGHGLDFILTCDLK
jgi:hypothetical protein